MYVLYRLPASQTVECLRYNLVSALRARLHLAQKAQKKALGVLPHADIDRVTVQALHLDYCAWLRVSTHTHTHTQESTNVRRPTIGGPSFSARGSLPVGMIVSPPAPVWD